MKDKKMEAALDGCKTATDVVIKAKHSKADIQKPSKLKFKSPGRFSCYLLFCADCLCLTVFVENLKKIDCRKNQYQMQ
jgi:hypothetical protein